MADWFVYDWPVRGVPGVFSVDLSYYDNLPEGHATLLWLSCASQDPEGVFSKGELRRAQGMLARAQKALTGAKYVGSIQLPGQIQYYFYTSREEQLEALEALEMKEKKLLITCGRAPEPRWQTYLQLLYPDAAKYQTVDNARIIDALRRQGDGLEASRRLRLSLFFPTEPSRLMFQEQARLCGFAIGDPLFRPEQHLPYGITLYCLSTLDKASVDAYTTRAIREAQRQGGEMMGWDCPIVPKKHPLG